MAISYLTITEIANILEKHPDATVVAVERSDTTIYRLVVPSLERVYFIKYDILIQAAKLLANFYTLVLTTYRIDYFDLDNIAYYGKFNFEAANGTPNYILTTNN